MEGGCSSRGSLWAGTAQPGTEVAGTAATLADVLIGMSVLVVHACACVRVYVHAATQQTQLEEGPPFLPFLSAATITGLCFRLLKQDASPLYRVMSRTNLSTASCGRCWSSQTDWTHCCR